MQRHAIAIELDYLGQPYDICRIIWLELRERMVLAGFRMEGRLFTIALPRDEAVQLARSTLEGIAEEMPLPAETIYTYIRDFYCFDHATFVNLLYPAIDATAFQIEEQ